MRSFILHKLVRTKITDNMEQMGQRVHYKQLNQLQFKQALVAKLQEEAAEVKIDNSEAALQELADLLEAMEVLTIELGYSFDSLRNAQQKRKSNSGSFDKDHFVERLDLDDNDEWADYYSAEPERFKEV